MFCNWEKVVLPRQFLKSQVCSPRNQSSTFPNNVIGKMALIINYS